MFRQYINELKLEFKKYTKFMVPEQVRTPANEAFKLLSDQPSIFPIDTPQNPIVAAFFQVLENKKTCKTSSSLIDVICDCLRIDAITGSALSMVLRKLELISDIDDETKLKIINFTTTIIVKHFLDLDILQSILSLSSTLCTSQSDLVSTSALASVNQSLSLFLTFAEKNQDNLSATNKRDIDLFYSMAENNSMSFPIHIHKIIYLILRDFVLISTGEQPKWLRINNLQSNISYTILQSIISGHSKLLKSNDNFMKLISSALSSSYTSQAPLSFCIVAIESFIDKIPNVCASIFSSFVRDLRIDSPKLRNSLIFFRIFILRNSSVAVDFFLKCDQNAYMLSKMLSSFKILIDGHDEFTRIDLSLAPKSLDWVPPNPVNSPADKVSNSALSSPTSNSQNISLASPGNLNQTNSGFSVHATNSTNASPLIPLSNSSFRKSTSDIPYEVEMYSSTGHFKSQPSLLFDPIFCVSAPIEITVFFVVSCYKAANPALKSLVSATWSDILFIIQIASTIVTGKCCYILMQGLHSLMVLTSELRLDGARGSVIGTFCNILVSPEGPDADEIKRIAYLTVSSLVETTPAVFDNHWSIIINALSDFYWIPQSFDFTRDLSLKSIVEMLKSFLSLKDEEESTIEWSFSLFSNIILTNLSQFKSIWSEIEEDFLLCITNSEAQYIASNSFFTILTDGFNENSEKQLCITIDKLLDKNCLDNEIIGVLIERIHSILSQNGRIIHEGWPPLLKALHPQHFGDDPDLMNAAFRCLQFICSDILISLDSDMQILIINLTIAFAEQKTDINISLSALGLLWNLTSVAQSSDMWITILKQSYPLIGDPRNDVSICAVNTFFSLLVSNSQNLSKEVFKFLAVNVDNIIDILIENRPECENAQMSAFHELAHCARNLYTQIDSVIDDQERIWDRVIKEHEKFILRSTKSEVVISSMLFYEEIFQCTHFSEALFITTFDSLDRLMSHFIKTENSNSPIYGTIGKMMKCSLSAQKEIMNVTFLKRWLKIIETLICELDSGPCLPPTAHMSLDALDTLFPLDEEMTYLLYESIVRIANYEPKQERDPSESNRMTEIAVDHLCRICREKVPKKILSKLFIMSKTLFKRKEARKLILDFVSNDIPVDDDLVESVCNSLMELGKSDTFVTLKTANSVLKLFSRVSNETKLEYINYYSKCYQALFGLWKIFLDPTSTDFDLETAKLCTLKVIDSIEMFLDQEKNDDETIIDVLNFVSDTPTLSTCFTESNDASNQFYHILRFLPKVSDLVFTNNSDVKQLVRKIILIVSNTLNR